MRVAVVGGGISGLTAAHRLVADGHDAILIDEAPQPGGLIASARIDGFLCERGPQAVLDGAEEVRALVAGAGLAERAIRALPASRRRFVYVGGKLRPFPASPPALIKTDLLSAAGKLRLLCEPFVKRRAADAPDESVFAFIARRFGTEAAERAAGPALIGVYAADAAAISVGAAFPRLAALEREHGSVLRGLLRSRGGARMGRPLSFPDGLGELPRALAAALGSRWLTGRAAALEPRAQSGAGWRVLLEGGAPPVDADRVVLATPAAAGAGLLAPHAPAAAAALRAIPHAPVAVVCLGFHATDAARMGMDLDAYGFVAARGEGVRLLGCQYESSVFPGRAPAGAVLLRALLGGTFDPALVDADDATLAAQAVADLRRTAGLRREPDLVQVWRARPGIPQVDAGQTARLRAIDGDLGRLPGLTLIGQAVRGVGVSACIQAATAAARQVGALRTT